MHFMHLNVLAIFVSAIACMVLGFLWYSPLLFANPWMKAMGYDPKDKAALEKLQKGAAKMYSLAFVASLISAGVLAKVLFAIGYGPDVPFNQTSYSIQIAAVIWFGFVMTVQLTNTLFGMKPMKLFMIDTGYQLVCYITMGAILGAWR